MNQNKNLEIQNAIVGTFFTTLLPKQEGEARPQRLKIKSIMHFKQNPSRVSTVVVNYFGDIDGYHVYTRYENVASDMDQYVQEIAQGRKRMANTDILSVFIA